MDCGLRSWLDRCPQTHLEPSQTVAEKPSKVHEATLHEMDTAIVQACLAEMLRFPTRRLHASKCDAASSVVLLAWRWNLE